MTTEFNKYLEQLKELELAAPDILDASSNAGATARCCNASAAARADAVSAAA